MFKKKKALASWIYILVGRRETVNRKQVNHRMLGASATGEKKDQRRVERARVGGAHCSAGSSGTLIKLLTLEQRPGGGALVLKLLPSLFHPEFYRTQMVPVIIFTVLLRMIHNNYQDA